MIKLTKQQKPKILSDNANNWTTNLTEKISEGQTLSDADKNKYRHKDIKAVLIEETNGKCAYCESKLLHIHHGDIEHIYPKSLAPEKTFEWENLTLACEKCNQNKSDNDPFINHIIDPYNIDPAQHLIFMGALVFNLGSPEGVNTINILKLDRSELVEMRKEQLEKIMNIYQTILRTDVPDPVKKVIYSNLLENEGSNKSPYTAMALRVIAEMENKLPSGIKI